MLLLFEGVDKSGKSTLLHNFRDYYQNSGSWKNTVFKPNSTVKAQGIIDGLYMGFYLAAFEMGEGRYPYCLDRSHITELVYGPVKRNYQPDYRFWEDFERIYRDKMCVIYVNTPLDSIVERIERDGDDYVRLGEVAIIKERYEHYISNAAARLKVIVIDGSKTQEEMLTELVSKLDEYLRKEWQSYYKGEGSSRSIVRSTI